MSTVREVTYEVLRNLAMTVIFGNPGSTELPFPRDMPSDFRYVLGLHERCAAGMALGYALARGKAAFANLHSIASAGNGLSAIIDSDYSHEIRQTTPEGGPATSASPAIRSGTENIWMMS